MHRQSLIAFALEHAGVWCSGGSAPRAALPRRPTAIVRSECAYTQAHLLAAFARRATSWDVLPAASLDDPSACAGAALWCDEYEALDWGVVMTPPHRLASSFFLRKGLGRKGNLAAALHAHAKRCGVSCPLRDGVPLTVTIDTFAVFHARPAWLDATSALAEAVFEAEEAMDAACAGARWILKPSVTNKGAGIVLIDSLDALTDALREERDVGQWVLQRYMDSPLLLPLSVASPSVGTPPPLHKWHLRVYALAVGALTVHVFREALVLLAPAPYAGAHPHDIGAHITNSCVGAGHGSFDPDTHVRCLSELPALLCAGGDARFVGPHGAEAACAAVASIFSDVCSLTAHAFASVEGDAGGFLPLPCAWELYGVDFLVDDSLRVVLLEFNPTPDIAQTGSRLDGVISAMLEGMLQLALDRRVVEVGCSAAAAAALRVGPSGGDVLVNVEPLDLDTHANGVVRDGMLPTWAPGCYASGAGGWDASGWDAVYSKKWRGAHGGVSISVS